MEMSASRKQRLNWAMCLSADFIDMCNLAGSPMFLDIKWERLGPLVSRPLLWGNEHSGYKVAACNGHPIPGGVVILLANSCYWQSCTSVFCLLVFVYFSEPIADFYSMSYLWFSGLSVLTSFVVGIIMSLILGKFTIDSPAHLFHSVPPYLNMSQHERCSQSRNWKAVPYRAMRYEWYLTSFFQHKHSVHQHCIFSFVVVVVVVVVVVLALFYILTVKGYAFKQTTNSFRHLFNQSYRKPKSIATFNWSSSFPALGSDYACI